ncbi:MAG TPA: cytochrome C, partial [Nitrosomonas sp.]|nr:cytochrome C [Nitrosomonas sp.]
MLEIIANFFHWVQLSANLILFGSCFFLTIVWQKKVVLEVSSSWLVRLEKTFPWLAGVVVLGLTGILATTTGEATGDIG